MDEWRNRFYEFMAEWMREVKKLPVAEITYVESETEEWFDYSDAHGISFSLAISWRDTSGHLHINHFDGGIEDILAYG